MNTNVMAGIGFALAVLSAIIVVKLHHHPMLVYF